MNRRDLFKLGGMLPAAAAAQKPPAVTITAPSADWRPVLFDPHQNATVLALAELLIPGSAAALVNRHLDKWLADGPANVRDGFLQGLGWLDGYAIRRHQQPFVRCRRDDQIAVLQILDDGSDPLVSPGHHFFGLAKRLAAQTYYATELGFKELNAGGRVPATFGCQTK